MNDASLMSSKRYPTFITLGLCAAAIAATAPFAVWHVLGNNWVNVLLIGGVDLCALIIGKRQ